MERRNKRDAKFLIFQSLYIIAISILFYKGTDLSLNKVTEIKEGQIVVDKDMVLENDMKSYDPTILEVLPKLNDSLEYKKVAFDQEVVSKSLLEEKDRKISELERLKTPGRRPEPTRNDPPEGTKPTKPKTGKAN